MQKSMLETNDAQSDLAACQALMRCGSRSFHTASKLLPRSVMEPATALYAFCRLADDAIDEGSCKTSALAELHGRLDRAYAGNPLPIPADRAFAATVKQYHIPRAIPLSLLEGFAWDSEGRTYETFDDLQDYAARVAGTVGAMMTVLMGARDAKALARACDLGIAMQITNIVRDIGEDARAGRLYLPLSWMRDAGIDPEAFLANPRFSPALAGIAYRLLKEAEKLYIRAQSGIALLPAACRPGIRAAGLIYAEIGQRAANAGYNTVAQRSRVSGARKLALLARSLATLSSVNDQTAAPPARAARYLVDAAAVAPVQARPARIDFVFDLFERLRARELGTL